MFDRGSFETGEEVVVLELEDVSVVESRVRGEALLQGEQALLRLALALYERAPRVVLRHTNPSQARFLRQRYKKSHQSIF